MVPGLRGPARCRNSPTRPAHPRPAVIDWRPSAANCGALIALGLLAAFDPGFGPAAPGAWPAAALLPAWGAWPRLARMAARRWSCWRDGALFVGGERSRRGGTALARAAGVPSWRRRGQGRSPRMVAGHVAAAGWRELRLGQRWRPTLRIHGTRWYLYRPGSGSGFGFATASPFPFHEPQSRIPDPGLINQTYPRRHRFALPARQAPQRLHLPSSRHVDPRHCARRRRADHHAGGDERIPARIRDRMLQMAAHRLTIMPTRRCRTGGRRWLRPIAPGVAGAAPHRIRWRALITGSTPAGDRARRDPGGGRQGLVLAKKMTQAGSTTSARRAQHRARQRNWRCGFGVGVGDNVVVTTNFQATPMGAVPRPSVSLPAASRGRLPEYEDGPGGGGELPGPAACMGDAATGVRLRLHDMDQSFKSRDDLLRLRGPTASPTGSRTTPTCSARLLEKTMMAILLSLIIAMGAFNPVLAGDAGHRQQADIAILRTFGLTPGGVMKVFMVQGSLIGVIGTVAGVVGGIVPIAQPRAHPAPDRTRVRRAADAGGRVLHHRPADATEASDDHHRLRRGWPWPSRNAAISGGAPAHRAGGGSSL